MTKLLLTISAVLALAAMPGGAQTQARDGEYTATIRCTAYPNTEIGAFSQQMSFRISGSAVSGERNVGTATQVGMGGVVEKWSGAISPDGTISMTSNSASSRAPMQGVFNGRATRDGFDAKGTQTFTSRTGVRSERSCSVAAKR